MSVKLRCTRTGRVHRPFFRIGAFDSRTRRDGAALEYLGYYDPILSTGQRVKLDREKVERWLGRGAIPSETVKTFLREAGIPFSKRERDRASNARRAGKRKVARARRRTTAPRAKGAQGGKG
jgi:small subunit ribosomal protein S16